MEPILRIAAELFGKGKQEQTLRPFRPRWLVGLLVALGACRAQDAPPLALTLPPVLYAVPGIETGFYYDNIVLTEKPEAYHFTVTADVGTAEARRWAVTPTADQVGDHHVFVTVADGDGRELDRAEMLLRVVPADAGQGRPVRLTLVGDSLTHSTAYANELARLLSLPGNPSWEMLGTHRPAGAADGVAHEGYGGWTWARFATHYEPEPDGTYKKRSSPFVFLGEDGKPVLDVARYYDENFNGRRPDVVTFLLGINDCFGAPPDDPAGIDARIDAMIAQAETLLAAFRAACPDAVLGVCLTTPPNARQAGFAANYGDKYTRWGWKRIQHHLVQRELAQFGNREAEGIDVVPTELYLDPVDGYPDNNGVHPNAVGYKQIAVSIYGWLKWRLDAATR